MVVVVTGLMAEPTLKSRLGDQRPPLKLPAPSSAIRSKTSATRLPCKALTSRSIKAERMLAETNRCSVAKRLPPPCAGMPVSVPQPLKTNSKKRISRRGFMPPI